MFEWSEEQLMVRDAVRRFVEAEVVPNIEALEHGDLPPYDIIRKLYATFGMDQMARDRFKKQLERKVSGAGAEIARASGPERPGDGGAAAMTLIPIIELCHYCPGIVTAMGVSLGLAAGTIMKQGTPAQMERWGLDLLTGDKVGRLGHHRARLGVRRPGRHEDHAPGGTATSTSSTATRRSSPTAPTPTPSSSTPSSTTARTRRSATGQVLTFVLDRGTPGLEQSKPFRKMGLHSSPTGELFLSDVRVGRDHLLGETEDEHVAGAVGIRPRATSSPSGPGWPPCPSGSSRSASSCRSSTPRTGCCGASPSATAS